MKFSLTFLAVLLASAIASPVLETRNSTAVFDKRAAHVKRGAVYNTAGAVVPLQSAYVDCLSVLILHAESFAQRSLGI
jgi:uncharacterized protein (UPF0333 family)